MNTPWGPAQEIAPIIDGMDLVSTASHGGLKLAVWRNARMPPYLRRPGGWYEEDCEWALACAVFEEEILAQAPDKSAATAIRDGSHKRTFANWWPDEYERFYGVKLEPGQSYKRTEQEFYRQHAQDWIGVSAYGAWKEGVPQSFVGVVACQGGHGAQPRGPCRCFLVPEAQYDQRSAHGFVIDLARHQEVPDWEGPATKQVPLEDFRNVIRRALEI